MLNAKDRWIPELRHHARHLPFILVGTKLDLIDSGEVPRLVSNAEGKDLKANQKARAYKECSAKSGAAVEEVFDRAKRVTMEEWSQGQAL
ncbi:putative small GTPase superfamily, P-loop containing nucleoside triphosphate hydrolase [Balamuthia mandrillaris]